MKRWAVRILTGLLVVVGAFVAVVYVASNRYINKRYAFHEYPVTVPADSTSRAEGERLARIRCFGCHGDSLKGQVFFDEPNVARLIAPNVPAKLATLGEDARAHGRDGTQVAHPLQGRGDCGDLRVHQRIASNWRCALSVGG